MIALAISLQLLAVGHIRLQTVLPDTSHSLMPVPASFQRRDGRLRIDTSFAVRTVAPAGDGRLARGVARFLRRLELQTGATLGNRQQATGNGQ